MSHESTSVQQTTYQHTAINIDRSLRLCIFMKKYRNCRNGDNCLYSHNNMNAETVFSQSYLTHHVTRSYNTNMESHSIQRICFCQRDHDYCAKGSLCPYADSHREGLRTIQLCSSVKKDGFCRKGLTCLYYHPQGDNTPTTSYCRYYFTSGGCNNGDMCNFSHGNSQDHKDNEVYEENREDCEKDNEVCEKDNEVCEKDNEVCEEDNEDCEKDQAYEENQDYEDQTDREENQVCEENHYENHDICSNTTDDQFESSVDLHFCNNIMYESEMIWVPMIRYRYIQISDISSS